MQSGLLVVSAASGLRIAYSYIRFSCKIQERGASLDRQTELSERYVKDHGLTLDDSLHLRDLGVSAFRGKNSKTGALAGFLAAIHSGRVRAGSVLLIENLDRLSRAELSESVALFLQIINSGVDIVTLIDGRTYTKRKLEMTDLIISIAVLSRGHEESSTKSFRVRDAYLRKVGKARELKGKFRITRMCPAWLRPNEQGGWEEIPEHGKVVREIFRLYDEGFGKWRICGILNERGIPTFARAKYWSARYIASVLTSPAVIGNFRPGHWTGGIHRYKEGEDIPGYFPRIISDELFQRCYSKLKSHYVPPTRPGRIHLLAGLVWCGHKDEQAVVWGTSKNEMRVNGVKTKYRYFYFVAKSVPVNRKQVYRSWNIADLERNFLLFCLNVDWDAIAEQKRTISNVDWAAKRKDLNVRRGELQKELENLYKMMASGEFKQAPDQIKKREKEQGEIDERLATIELEEAKEKETKEAMGAGFNEGEALMKKVLLDGADVDTRLRLREEIRKRVERIVIYAMGYDIGPMIRETTGVPLRVNAPTRCYKVLFRNGVVRWVVPNGKKDTEIKLILDDWEDSTAQAAAELKSPAVEEFQVPESTNRRGGRKKRTWQGMNNVDKKNGKKNI